MARERAKNMRCEALRNETKLEKVCSKFSIADGMKIAKEIPAAVAAAFYLKHFVLFENLKYF